MIYLLFLAVAAVSAVAVYAYCCYEGVFCPFFFRVPQKASSGEEWVPFTKLLSALITAAAFLMLLVVQFSLYGNTQSVAFIKLYVLLVIVICAGIVDFKKKIIPNLLVMFGLLFWVGITVYDISNTDDIKALLGSELIALALGFGLLAVVSVLTKGAIGFGDVKLFGVIGLISGAFCTYSTLFVSMALSAVVAIVGLLAKKIGRKDSIAFGPCIMLGYLIVLLLGSY